TDMMQFETATVRTVEDGPKKADQLPSQPVDSDVGAADFPNFHPAVDVTDIVDADTPCGLSECGVPTLRGVEEVVVLMRSAVTALPFRSESDSAGALWDRADIRL